MNTGGTIPAVAPHTLGPRRGPLHERLSAYEAEWRIVNNYHAVARIATVADAGPLRLCDVTHRARFGCKGRGAADWLQTQGIALPPAPNRWRATAGGALIARLGPEDFLLCDDFDGDAGLPAQLDHGWHADAAAGGYPVPRQFAVAALIIDGAAAPALFARLCAVDLRPQHFAPDAVAQTFVANCTATVLRRDRGGEPGYLVFVDTTLAVYLWDLLLATAANLHGRAVGFAQLAAD